MESLAINLNEDQMNWLKARFDVRTDAEVRNKLQMMVNNIIDYQRDIHKELSDLNSMKESSRIRG